MVQPEPGGAETGRLMLINGTFHFSLGSIPGLSLYKLGQGLAHFFQGSPSRCADFKSFSNAYIANLSGFTAAEVGFLVVKPFKKHPFLASGTNGGTKWECSLLPTRAAARCLCPAAMKPGLVPSLPVPLIFLSRPLEQGIY